MQHDNLTLLLSVIADTKRRSAFFRNTDALSELLKRLPEQERNGYFEGMEVEPQRTWDKDTGRWTYPSLAQKHCYLAQEQFPFINLYSLSEARFEELLNKHVPFFYDPRFGVRFFEGVQGAAFATIHGMSCGIVPTATQNELTSDFLDQASDVYDRAGDLLPISYALRNTASGPTKNWCPKLVFTERNGIGFSLCKNAVEVRRNSALNSGLLYYNVWDVLAAARHLAQRRARSLARSNGNSILADVYQSYFSPGAPDVLEVTRTCKLRQCDFLTITEIKLISQRVTPFIEPLAQVAKSLEVSYVAF